MPFGVLSRRDSDSPARRPLAVWATVAVVTAVGAVAVTVTSTTPTRSVDAALTASVTECHDMVGISISGRGNGLSKVTDPADSRWLLDANGDPLPASTEFDDGWLDRIEAAGTEAIGPDQYVSVSIAYPANMGTYEDSVEAGVANAEHVMREISAACPGTQFAIVGYSQGADVARRVAMDIGNQPADTAYTIVDPADVLGVVIIADSGRSAGDGPFPGAQDPFAHPDGYDVAYQAGTTPVPGRGALAGTAGGFGALDGKVASFCSDGDLTCAAPENAALVDLVVNIALQMHIDSIENSGPTVDTFVEFGEVFTRVLFDTFADIGTQPAWLASDETFLQALVRVSAPTYTTPAEHTDDAHDVLTRVTSLVYLPRKMFLEVVGFVLDNPGTLEFLMTDAYESTFAVGTGHHFDYWRDADPATGRTSSVDYAAAWLAHLAVQASEGKSPAPTAPDGAELDAAVASYAESRAVLASHDASAAEPPATASPDTVEPHPLPAPATTEARPIDTEPSLGTTPTTDPDDIAGPTVAGATSESATATVTSSEAGTASAEAPTGR
ncbi:cutinase family protein [Rhodococcus sp. HNM0569]|uniref:cutinase family protein n=1 Tax=Rhodococcus sp. HNM0569 TaxID=2716340 RepID=UPI00146F8147|nr:cutinase family protein [Rhodococcus sp. HNM0569]NLU81356.1 cutinase family protein [Rhodococcus sp. HNM0569]